MGAVLSAAAAGFMVLPLLPRLPPAWPLLALAAVLLAAGWRGRRTGALAAAAFLGALGWAVAVAGAALAARIPAAWEERPVTAWGEVEELPLPAAPQGLRFRFRPLHVRVDGQAVPPTGPGRWQLFVPYVPRLQPGDRCRLTLRLKRPHGVANPGGFDHEAWLLAEGITATGSVRQLVCTAAPGAGPDRLRLRLRETFQRRFPERPAAGVVLALVTGDRALVPAAAWELYTATGVVHLMAISGLHVTLLAVLAVALARRLLRTVPRLALACPLHKPALLVGLAVATAYSLVAGLTIPTLRTLVMLGVVVLAACLERRLPPFQVLLLALVAVLAGSPLAVHAAGFWLSFGAVALLLLLGGALRGLPAWRQALQAQLAISLLLLPLTLWFFERVSWVAPLANLLAVPLVTLLVVPLGLLGLLLWLAGLDGAAQLAWQGATGLVEVLDALMEQFAAWPWASADFSLPGAAGLLWLVLALLCLLQPLQRRLRLLAPVFLLPLLLPPAALRPGELRLTVLDVGQGLAVLVETAGHRLLYDTGPGLGPEADAGRRYVLPALHGLGVYALDRLVLSHDDGDHTGGAQSLLAAMPVRDGLGALPRGLRLPPGLPWSACRAGQAWHWDGWDFRVLYPSEEQFLYAPGDNNRSCVLHIRRGQRAVLLPGDLERIGELSLLAQVPAPALQASVLVLGHHGSRGASSPEFLAAVQPAWALVSAGYRNRFHHPSAQVLARLAARGIPWRNTAASGALTLHVAADGSLHLEEFRRRAARYWQADDRPAFFAKSTAPVALGGVGVNR